jgi:hypothetical protein
VKDHSILEALSASLDDQQDRHLGSASSASEAKHFNETQHFSAVYEGKARRIAKITDTRTHQRMEQALVEWTDGTTAWIGIHDLSSAAQDHVRERMQQELGVLEEQDAKSESKTRKRYRKSISQHASYKQRGKKQHERKKRQKKKEADELDGKLSMPTCASVVKFIFRRDVGQC